MASYLNLIPVAPGDPPRVYLEKREVWGKVYDRLLGRTDLVPFRHVIPLDMEKRVRAWARLGPKPMKYFRILVQDSNGIDLCRWFNVPGCKIEEVLSKKDCIWSYLIDLGLGRIQAKTKEMKATNNAFNPFIQFLTGIAPYYQ